MREDHRVIRTVRLQDDDAICKTCVQPIRQGKLAHWSQGGIVWHLTCSVPAMPPYTPTEEEADARLEQWMDSKIEQEAERRGRGGLASASTVGASTGTTESHPSQAPTTIPASLTSNPKYQEQF